MGAMDDSPASEVYNSLLLYMLQAATPGDPTWFGEIAGPRGPLGDVTALCFLLYRPRDTGSACAHRFLFHIAPVLLHQLSRTTKPQRVVLHGRIQGKVDWSSTYKARYSEDANPTVFVCQQSRRRFDRPENQLFRFLLHHIQLCLDRVSSSLRGWQAWGRGLCTPDGQPLVVADSLARLAHRVHVFSSHIYLREVGLPATIGGQHVLAARTSKTELYAEVANLYDLYQAVVGAPDWAQWATVLRETLPLPPAAYEVGRLLTPMI
jgi:hypothetical protein